MVVLSSTARTRDVLHVSRAFVESSLGNHLFHFGLQSARWLAGAEGYVSLGSLSLILTSSISSTVNLFTGSDQGTCLASCSMQNPP